jgi:hypothetical protein
MCRIVPKFGEFNCTNSYYIVAALYSNFSTRDMQYIFYTQGLMGSVVSIFSSGELKV